MGVESERSLDAREVDEDDLRGLVPRKGQATATSQRGGSKGAGVAVNGV